MSLRLRAVAKRHGDRTLFQAVDLDVASGEKTALIGPNGSGKSTLLRLIAGLEAPDAGTIHVRGTVSLLAQVTEAGDARVSDWLLPPALALAAADLAAAERGLTAATPVAIERYAAAEERFRAAGGYDHATRTERVLDGLAIDGGARMSELSGGQRRRVHLARQLLTRADLLLLDEPTNHLDRDGIEWLESWLRASDAAAVVVSHDRQFLDATVSSVAELTSGSLTPWPGNYSAALALKEAALATQHRRHEAEARKKRELEVEAARLRSAGRSADRFNRRRAGNQAVVLAKAKAENVSRTLAGRARALERRLDRFEVTPAPREDEAVVTIPTAPTPSAGTRPGATADEPRTGPTEVVRLAGVTLERGGRRLFTGLDLLIRRGERVALVGANGSGKSSLIATVVGELAPTAGTVTLGRGLTWRFAGQHGEELGAFVTVEDAVRDANPLISRQELHHLLARLGLPPDPQREVVTLSGGQRTRLSLARSSVSRAALLILDEPTNHLDAGMVAALEEHLMARAGTLLFASHDRRLVARVATRVIDCSRLAQAGR